MCGVGLCDTGTLIAQVRKATAIPSETPLVTLQGGICLDKLKGVDKLLISMLTKGLSGQKQRTDEEERMLELFKTSANYVSKENLSEVLAWYENTNSNI